MKKIMFAVLLAAFSAVPAAAQSGGAATVVAVAGKMLFDADGKRLGAIYRVNADGSAQLILEERQVTVPAATISETDGKFTTSLTKREILKRR